MALLQQRCLHHPAREAVAQCPECGHSYCRECVTEHEDRVLCASCLGKRKQAAAHHLMDGGRALRLLQILLGLFLAWVFFYSLGQALLAIPSAFHEGTVWKSLNLQ
jgi:hypothetical protein